MFAEAFGKGTVGDLLKLCFELADDDCFSSAHNHIIVGYADLDIAMDFKFSAVDSAALLFEVLPVILLLLVIMIDIFILIMFTFSC